MRRASLARVTAVCTLAGCCAFVACSSDPAIPPYVAPDGSTDLDAAVAPDAAGDVAAPPEGGPTDGGGAALSAACAALADAAFAVIDKCSASVPPSLEPSAKARAQKVCEQNAVLPGVQMTPADIQACAVAYASFAPNCVLDFATYLTSCKALLGGGKLGNGTACNASVQCQSSRCTIPAPGDAGAPSYCGACTPTALPGQACKSSLDCNASNCVKSVCVAYASVVQGGDCASDSDCQKGLRCSSTLKCQPPLGKGGACTSGQDCALGLKCSAKVCSDPIPLGGDCSTNVLGCVGGTSCDATGTKKCVAPPPSLAPGDACGPGKSCFLGACYVTGDAGTGKCPAVIPDGQPCNAADKSKVCDYDAQCINGVCMLGAPVCK